MKNTTNSAKVLKHFRENRYNMPEPLSKFEPGGVSSECAGKPKKPRCRRKSRSRSKSKETQGGILGTVLGGLAGLGAWKGYKYMKEKEGG